MTTTNFSFGALSFSTTDELHDYCQTLRLGSPAGTLIEGTDNHLLLHHLFNVSRKNRHRLKGRAILAWTTQTNTAGGLGLSAILTDGTFLSFSIAKAVDDYLARQSREF